MKTKIKWIYGKFGDEGNDLEYKINEALKELEKEYGEIIVNHIELTSTGWGKDAMIVYSYEEYKNCDCNGKCHVEKLAKSKSYDEFLEEQIKEYRKNIIILDSYFATDGTYSSQYVKIKDNNKKIFKKKTLEGSIAAKSEKIVTDYIKEQIEVIK